MRQSTEGISFHLAVTRGFALSLLSVLLLAGCQTDDVGISSTAQAAKPAGPITHTEAAAQCWMSTEKGAASASLDKRADIVNQCIDDKMKGAPAAPKS